MPPKGSRTIKNAAAAPSTAPVVVDTGSASPYHYVVGSTPSPLSASLLDEDGVSILSMGADQATAAGGSSSSSSSQLALDMMAARKVLEEEIQEMDVDIFRLETEFLSSASDLSSAGGSLLSSGLHLPQQASGQQQQQQGMLVSVIASSPTAASLSSPLFARSGNVRAIAVHERVFTATSTTALASVEIAHARARRGALMSRKRVRSAD